MIWYGMVWYLYSIMTTLCRSQESNPICNATLARRFTITCTYAYLPAPTCHYLRLRYHHHHHLHMRQGKFQLLPPEPLYYPFPRGKIHTRGDIWSFTAGWYECRDPTGGVGGALQFPLHCAVSTPRATTGRWTVHAHTHHSTIRSSKQNGSGASNTA